MGLAYTRIEDDDTTQVSIRDGLTEVNNAMLSGRCVALVTAYTQGHFRLDYFDGRRVQLVRTEVLPTKDDEPVWSPSVRYGSLLHRYTDVEDLSDRQALCDSRLMPARYDGCDSFSFLTRTERDAGPYSGMFTYCPTCAEK